MTSRICFLQVTGFHHISGGIITSSCNNNLRILSSTTTPLRSSSSGQVDAVLFRRSSTPTTQQHHHLSSFNRLHHHYKSTFCGIIPSSSSSSRFNNHDRRPSYRSKSTTTMSQKEMLSPAQVHAMLTDESESSTVYVDVRTTSEFNGGHIPQSVNLPVVTFGLTGMSPVESFPDDLATQISEKGYTKVIVGCKSGRRSTMAIDKFVMKHPEVVEKVSIYEMDGGFDNYTGNQELPVEKK